MPSKGMKTQSEPRIAVIGCGHWGKQHCRVASGLGVLRAVCDVDESQAAIMVERYPEPWVYGESFEKVLQDQSIDAVIIATPTETHHALTMQALDAGKHVLVEKPMSTKVAQAEAMVALAKEKGLVLMPGHVMLYHSAVAALRQIMYDGKLGQIQYLYSNRLNLGKVRQHESVMWSFAPHDISIMLYLLGVPPKRVTAWGARCLSAIEDITVMMLEFPADICAHIHVSWLHPFKEHRFVVIGSKGMAVFDDVEHKVTVYNQCMEGLHGRAAPDEISRPMYFNLDGMLEPLHYEINDFCRAIRYDTTPLASGANGMEVMRVLEKAEKALRDKATCGT